MPFSGKSEAVKIAGIMKIPVVRMGDMVWEEVRRRGLEINDENVGKIANNMRQEKGKDIWAKCTIEKIKTLNKVEILVVDGVRNLEEIEAFKKEIGEDFVVVAVEVSEETRYKRAMNRGREDDSMDLEKIRERDKREIGWGLDTVIASADIVISNEGALAEFCDKIKEVLSKN